MAAADADAEEPRQCMDHLDGVGVLPRSHIQAMESSVL